MTSARVAKHSPAVCDRIAGSVDFHGKSYSYRHACPTCGKSRRYNSNFLGNKYELVCDGTRIFRHRRGDAMIWTVANVEASCVRV